MRDSDTPAAIPVRGTDIAAGYVTGRGKWPAKAYARFRRIEQARIDCRGTKPAKADILDVEQGCSTIRRAVSWVKERNAAYPGAYPPIIYCSRDPIDSLLAAMRAAGLHLVKDYRLWITTLDGTKTLPNMTGVVAVQYKRAPVQKKDGTWEAPGPSITAGHYDESIVYDDSWDPGSDLPYTKKQLVKWVKKGVAAELNADETRKEILDMVKMGVAAALNAPDPSGVTPAQGAQAAVRAQGAVGGLAQQLADLTALVQALPAAPATPPRTQTPAGTTTPARTNTPAGTTTPSGNGMARGRGRASG